MRDNYTNNPNRDNVLIKLKTDGDYLRIWTCDRVHGLSRCFIVQREAVARAMNGECVVESDIDGFTEIFERNAAMLVKMYWISTNGDTLSGYKQFMELPKELLQDLVTGNRQIVRYLYRPGKPQARIDTSHAGKVVREATRTPALRRALSKAMRDNFHWGREETITLYRDYNACDFYFRTSSGCPTEGGLILHKSIIRTPVGRRPRLQYGIHT